MVCITPLNKPPTDHAIYSFLLEMPSPVLNRCSLRLGSYKELELQAQFIDLIGRNPDSDDEGEPDTAMTSSLPLLDLISKVRRKCALDRSAFSSITWMTPLLWKVLHLFSPCFGR